MLNGLSIADSATSLSVTGGTAQTFTADGQAVANGLHVAAMAVTDFRVRPHISFKNRNPVRKSDGTFTNGVRTFVYTEPYLTSDGRIVYDTIEVSRRTAPEIPAANQKNARYKAAQLMFDADLENYNANGDIS